MEAKIGSFFKSAYIVNIAFVEEIEQWCISNNIEKHITKHQTDLILTNMRRTYWQIRFKTEDELSYFALTWCDNNNVFLYLKDFKNQCGY